MSNSDQDRARDRLADNMKESAARVQADSAATEARKKSSKRLPPHLIEYQGAKRCSICKMPFHATDEKSLSKAFVGRVLKEHRPGQTSEDVNRTTA